MCSRRIFLPFAVVVFAVAVAACAGPKTPSATFKAGDSFNTVVIEVRGDTASTYWLRNNQSSRTKAVKKKLTPQQQEDFWRALDGAEFDRWNSSYVRTRDDGRTAYGDWSIVVNRNGEIHRSEGDAYPSDRDPKATVQLETSRRYDSVWEAFSNACSPTP